MIATFNTVGANPMAYLYVNPAELGALARAMRWRAKHFGANEQEEAIQRELDEAITYLRDNARPDGSAPEGKPT